MDLFKKIIGYIFGFIGALSFIRSVGIIIDSIIQKELISNVALIILQITFDGLIFGLPFYLLVVQSSGPEIKYFNTIIQNIEQKNMTWEDSIKEIKNNNSKKLKPKILYSIGFLLYDYYLKKYIADLQLAAEELERLEELEELEKISLYFNLPPYIINEIKRTCIKDTANKLSS